MFKVFDCRLLVIVTICILSLTDWFAFKRSQSGGSSPSIPSHGLFQLDIHPGHHYLQEYCPSAYYNPTFAAWDVFDIPVDKNIVREINLQYERNLRPHAENMTDLPLDDTFVNTFVERWYVRIPSRNHRISNNLRWYSAASEETHMKYSRYVEQLGITRLLEHFVTDELILSAVFFMVRSRTEEHVFHLDWKREVHLNAFTVVIPLRDSALGVNYMDTSGKMRTYDYKFGRGIVFMPRFNHSSPVGVSSEPDVLLSLAFSSTDPTLWELFYERVHRQLRYYMDPQKQWKVAPEYYGPNIEIDR